MSVDALRAGRPATPSEAGQDRKVLEAAKQFERMLLRTMLSQLEKSAHLGKQGSATSGGSSVYSSMIADALADAVANAGGVGLADKVAEGLQRRDGR